MKKIFTARIWNEGDIFIAQCVQVDVVSDGRTEREALDNLREALELYFTPPMPTISTKIADIEVEVGAA
jgi:predicted RNase H-like HicB family nuclease